MEPWAGISKQDIREQIWDYMESQNLADFPRPVHHRIPNFKGAARAADHLPRLQAFRMARTIKVNPDAPQKHARFSILKGSHLAGQNLQGLEVFSRSQEVKVDPDKPLEGARLLALQSKKTLLVPTPRLRTGLFNRITPPPGATKDTLRKCATSQGVRSYSVPLGLDARVTVDLVVVGSVAVSEKGWRIGKGEGYADLEYAMMASMGAVGPGTPVVTIVHDCQVVDIPESLLEDHDLSVDYILTPTRVVATGCQRPRPTGIMWSKVSCEMLGKIPVLRSLRQREKQAGKDVALRDERRHLPETHGGEKAPSSADKRPGVPARPEVGAAWDEGAPSSSKPPPAASVYVGNLPPGARVRELKCALRELGSMPVQLTWQGPQGRAFLHYQDQASAQQAVSRLQGLYLGTSPLRVALARPQRARCLEGGCAAEPHLDLGPAASDAEAPMGPSGPKEPSLL